MFISVGTILLVLYVVVVCVALPASLIWGWVRWARSARQRTLSAKLSFAGFTLATASALVAVLSVLYARAIGGLSAGDPRLLRIFASGDLLSLSAVILAISGVWRPSPLRWHALACSAGTLLFWAVTAASE